MKYIYIYILFLFIFKSNSKLSEDKKKELFSKYAKPITINNLQNIKSFDDDILLSSSNPNLRATINYDKEKIRQIIKEYEFPESYDFIKDTKAPVHIKNQGICSSCWAMASTSALGYRFYKKGINVNLSPQHELSCYIKSCEKGNSLIDPQLSLIINGTLTEECFPYSSGSGNVEQCPSKCKDPNIEYKKYYAKNAYTINMDETNMYDVTAIIMDQLIREGPVMTSIKVYEDMEELTSEKDCQNKVYTYDGKSKFLSGHAIIIMGYGFLDDKFYWLIQNTWGEDSCGNGFLKIEFGQVDIGSVSFAEPLINNEESTKLIELSYVSMDDQCNIAIKTNNNLDNWKTQLVILFEHDKENNEFDYICAVNKVLGKEKEIHCYYEIENIQLYKGTYKFKTFRITGKKNNFVFDNTFKNLEFNFYGNDKIYSLNSVMVDFMTYSYNYISKNYRRIYFLLELTGTGYDLPAISPNEKNSSIILSNCSRTNTIFNELYLSYCDINDEEINYFENYSISCKERMVSRSYCGVTIFRGIITCSVDENIIPIFKIKTFEILNIDEDSISTSLTADIEGNTLGNLEKSDAFGVVIYVEIMNKNYTDTMVCNFGNPMNGKKNYKIECNIYILLKFDNIFVTPYYSPSNSKNAFIININDIIKGNNQIKSRSTLL